MLHRKPTYRLRVTTMINDIRSLFTKVLFASFVAASPLMAQAAGSPVFDNWTVSGGTIQALGGNVNDAPAQRVSPVKSRRGATASSRCSGSM